ncbi:YbaB/EbfC family DNA-binding protein [Amycolatopsis sp. NPDC004079]|uniref:YbaB/EbfC family DNA-binding protein n=1 Tax=Amycolatopsis sp. NPDC004079 TaxID=3154549 RepID=UPI0033B34585
MVAEFDMDRAVARVMEEASRTGEAAAARFERAGPVVGKAAAGGVSVEVAPGGLLTGLTLTRAALRSGSEAVASQILELSRRAERRAGDRMHQVLAPVLGAEAVASLGYAALAEDDPDFYDEEPVVL